MNWMLCIFILGLCGCQQKSQETHYKEIVSQVPQANTPSVPAAPTMPSQDGSLSHMFTWTTPGGWKQEAAGGMRLASFHLDSDPKAIDCSLVALGGMAGGLEANLRRWMGQIGIKVSDEKLANLISKAPGTRIKSGQEAKIFDLPSIQSKADLNDKSMIVVMAAFDEMTLFVKMAGTIDSVGKNKNDFLKLANSVEYHPSSNNSQMASAPTNPRVDPHAGLDMSAMAGLIEAPTSQNLITWKGPDAWKEEPGKHMRMVTFHPVVDPQAIDCSIIALGGPAGGLEANLQRWLGQVGLSPSDDNVKQLIVTSQNAKTQDGLDIKVFDFIILQAQGSPSDASMMVAMLPVAQTTVFVKMMGSVKAVKDNKDNFLKLLGSIKRK